MNSSLLKMLLSIRQVIYYHSSERQTPKAAMTSRQYCLQYAVDGFVSWRWQKSCFCLLEDENKSCVSWCYPPTFAKNLILFRIQWCASWPKWINRWPSRSSQTKIVPFSEASISWSFSSITSSLIEIERWFCHHRLFLVNADRLLYFVTRKGHQVNLTSGHPRSRSRIDLNRSSCISQDEYWREEHFGTYPTSLSHSIQKL